MSSPSPILEQTSFWHRFHSEPTVFTTALSREECIRRLREKVGSGWLTDPGRPVVGRVTSTGALLRRQTKVRNNLTTMVGLKFQDSGGGTRIVCNFGIGTIMFLIMLAWSVIVMCAAIAFVLVQTRLSFTDVALLPVLLVPVVIVAAVVILTITLRRQAPGNRQFLSDFIRTTLDATEVKTTLA